MNCKIVFIEHLLNVDNENWLQIVQLRMRCIKYICVNIKGAFVIVNNVFMHFPPSTRGLLPDDSIHLARSVQEKKKINVIYKTP